MRVTFIILLLTLYLISHSQVRYDKHTRDSLILESLKKLTFKRFDKYTTDTIFLKSVTFKKTLAYKIEEVTLLVDFEEYRQALDDHRMRSKNMLSTFSNDPDMRKASLFIDSVYLLINAQVATQDTFFLTQNVFDFSLAPRNNFFPDLIENGKCTIVDENNKKHFLIIREKGSSINSYGGRMYYLPGKEKPFIIATDRFY